MVILMLTTTTLSSTLAVAGDTGIDGDFDVNNDKFTVAATSGNTAMVVH